MCATETARQPKYLNSQGKKNVLVMICFQAFLKNSFNLKLIREKSM